MSSKKSKKYNKMKELVPEGAVDIKTAVTTLKSFEGAKFDESVEVAINLNIDAKNSDQQVRGTVILPHGTGKKIRILALAQGDAAKSAQAAGADYVGDDDMVAKIKEGWLDFDKVVATPDMMKKISQVAKILGPRGLMPNPKLGTVTPDIAAAVENQKKGMVEFRADKGGVIHVAIGKKTFSEDQLAENYVSLINAITRSRPSTIKGDFFKGIYVSTTYSPAVAIK